MRIFLCIVVGMLAGSSVWAQTIVLPPDAPPAMKLAASEIRRYVYLRTRKLLPIATTGDGIALKIDRALAGQEYRIAPGGISGGSDIGVLYGAYRYAELLGVRFYIHGDVIPDEPLALERLPQFSDAGKPLFALRGLNPWGSHPFGFDAWTTDDYKAVFSQLTKMRMNFLGVHCYPEGHPYAEPTVWLGTRGDFDARGRVNASYPSHYYNTLAKGVWGPFLPKKTGDFGFGGAMLFEDDAWSPQVMRDQCPGPATAAGCNDVFNRMGEEFRDAFTFARELGVKTCIGTELPMILPKALRDRLKEQGKNPDDPGTIREVYEAVFRRIAAAHPLDYFWLWTPEGWTWGGNKPEQYAATVADARLAIDALKASGAPFRLATCGWVLGPQHDRAAFDRDLPKDIPMSAISRQLGWAGLDAAFGRIESREKWAIPWFESDGNQGLAAIQLFVGRTRRDAADALAYGCTGLMGLQWRTDIIAPNIAALAQASWNQSPWNASAGKLPGAQAVAVDGAIGGQIAAFPGRRIAHASDPTVYQTCRYGMDGYNLKLPNGRYRVTLGFCEPHFDAAGQRIGDFLLQGKVVIENLDIFARAGKFAAIDFTFDDIDVTDGQLHLGVRAKTSLPCISAIVAQGAAVTRKINCGGPAYRDFEADDHAPLKDHNRAMPCDDFYADWAAANFGLADAGRIFAAIDGRVPISVAGGCPSGSLKADATPWEKIAPGYAFIGQLESLRPRIQGAGNIERFDWWLNTFRYHRSLHEIRCALGRFDQLLKDKKMEAALEQYKRMLALYGDAYETLLATVNTPGGLAMVVNMECHAQFRPVAIDEPGKRLAAAMGHGLGADAVPVKTYRGKARLIVPTVRTVIRRSETLGLKIIVLDNRAAKSVVVKIRPLGGREWSTLAAAHVNAGVYSARIPARAEDFEYHVVAETGDGAMLVWPAGAPGNNQSVVGCGN